MFERNEYTLFCGGHEGTEEVFGICAEQWGLNEVTLNFEGHPIARDRGLRVLSSEELLHGDVSMDIVSRHMERSYAATPQLRGVFQTLYHIVNSGYQVFAAGWILSSNTVKGGTGWGVELAKLFNRPIHVFDLDKHEWLTWKGGQWVLEEHPVICHKTFCATGTRDINDEAKLAIKDLFMRSFGAPIKQEVL